MSSGRFMVTLDGVSYKAKPSAEVAAITRRMQEAGATECDAATFCEHIRQGRTWCGGCYAPKRGAWGEFQGQQIFALDFDNAEGKRQLQPGEVGYLDPLDALRRCYDLGIRPMCLYFTFSAELDPLWYKYRIVFDMGRPLDKDEAQKAITTLLAAFPEADKQCKNSNRLFFGSNGDVVECWLTWGGDNG